MAIITKQMLRSNFANSKHNTLVQDALFWAVAFRPVIAVAKGFAVLGNPVHLIWHLARPDLAPVFLAIAGHSTQRATLKASMCIEAVEAKAALPSCSIVRAHARDPRTRIRYTPVHPAPALIV